MLQPSRRIRSHFVLLITICAGLLPAHGWWPTLYPEDWTPPESASFTTDKLIQDFSYAGYRRGLEPIPQIAGPVYDVTQTPYGADPAGTSDSTAAIQAAIDDAAAAGGGVVYFPMGTYLVEPQGTDNAALRIAASNIVLRGAGVGQTYILNTSYVMRAKAILRIAPPSTTLGDPVLITADLDSPTRRIPVADTSAFDVGDVVRMEWSFTQGWIDEHNQGAWWSEGSAPSPAQYLREVTAVNPSAGWIEVDSPTRYTMRVRDNALVRSMSGHLSGVGIEDLSIGNVQHPGSTFADGAYTSSGTAAYDVHASWAISMQDCYDSWITGIESYQAPGNTTTCHILSNGIYLLRSFRVTVADCAMRRSQYGGGGGNGYMYRIHQSHDNLMMDCIADFSRHGIVISHAGTSGNVFLRCEDRETARSTGSTTDGSGYTTGGSGSDHHMHFSHSNLFDQCHGFNSFYTAHHRTSIGTVAHGLTSAHGVYWNTSGSGSRGGQIVRSEQGRYGYVIGTSGARSSVSTPTGGNTAPADHVEGVGIGDTLTAPSLYLDQLAKRAQGILLSLGEGGTIPPSSDFPLDATVYSYGSGPVSYLWTQVSGPTATIADATSPTTTVEVLTNGSYVFELTAVDGALSNSAQITVTVDESVVDPSITPATLVTVDGIRGRTENETDFPTGYFSPSTNTNAGATGSNGSRNDWNVIYRYTLPSLPVGEVVTAFTLSFQITALRDHSNNDYQLHAYLLDVADATATGTDLFYHGPNDANHAFVGSHFEVSGSDTDTILLPSPVDVTFTVDSGPALALLQSYYTENEPNRIEAAFRFNLDQLFPSLTGNALNRYILNHAANSLQIQSVPGPGISFSEWIAGFDVGALTGLADDPDGDGIPNGVENFFGTTPDAPTQGLVAAAVSGDTFTFSHPQNPAPANNLTATYRWSTDLSAYHGDGDEFGGTTVNFTTAADTPQAGTTTVTATITGTTVSSLFFNIEVIEE